MSRVSPVAWLDRLTSLKRRLSIIILVAIGSAVAAVTVGRSLGVGWFPAAGLGTAVALLLVRSLARGTTSRIRELAAATDAIAHGDHAHRVEVRGLDEVSHLAEAFNTMAAELEETDRARRNFIADASHELRTPIAAARAVLENMVDGVAPSSPEHLRPVLGQVERLGRLVDQLLDLSRLESGAVPLAAAPVDLASVVDEVVAAAKMVDAGVCIEVRAEPTVVLGDSERLRQVVTNLVDNARRFAPSTTPIIVSVAARGADAELSVEDHGPGIALADRERVFERFARGDRARASTDGGAGLGLSIVQWIVEQHDGSIRVAGGDSDAHGGHPAGPGCRMVVTLPLAAMSAAATT